MMDEVTNLSVRKPDKEPRFEENTLSDIEYRGLLGAETENASYVIHPGNHKKTSKIDEDLLSDIDGLVLETGESDYRGWGLKSLKNQKQYHDILENYLEDPRPIYNIDIAYSDNGLSLELLTGGPLVSSVSGALAERGFSKDITSTLQLSSFYSSNGLRSAIMAEKAEEFVSTELSQEESEKPLILFEVGSGHLDIKRYLENSKIRKNLIRAHSWFGYSHLENYQLDQVCKYEFAQNGDNELDEIRYNKIIYEVEGLVDNF